MIFPQEESLLYFDIETVREHKYLNTVQYTEITGKKPRNNNKEIFELVDPKGYRVFQDTHKKSSYLGTDLNLEDFYLEKGGLLPSFSKIICITIGYVHDGELRLKNFKNDNEAELLREFTKIMNSSFFYNSVPVAWQDDKRLKSMNVETPFTEHTNKGLFTYTRYGGNWFTRKPKFTLCGQNINKFDIPFIWKRSIANGIMPTNFIPHPNTPNYEINTCDTKDIFNYNNYRGSVSLDTQLWLVGLESSKDGDVCGSEVGDCYYNIGKFENMKNSLDVISEYCERDVIALYQYVKKLNNLEIID